MALPSGTMQKRVTDETPARYWMVRTQRFLAGRWYRGIGVLAAFVLTLLLTTALTFNGDLEHGQLLGWNATWWTSFVLSAMLTSLSLLLTIALSMQTAMVIRVVFLMLTAIVIAALQWPFVRDHAYLHPGWFPLGVPSRRFAA